MYFNRVALTDVDLEVRVPFLAGGRSGEIVLAVLTMGFDIRFMLHPSFTLCLVDFAIQFTAIILVEQDYPYMSVSEADLLPAPQIVFAG